MELSWQHSRGYKMPLLVPSMKSNAYAAYALSLDPLSINIEAMCRNNQCQHLLFEAGADPTIVTDHKNNTCFFTESLGRQMVFMKFQPHDLPDV